jgi:beta-phosphoglucomutase-like phosphatase (HAD superfamily)
MSEKVVLPKFDLPGKQTHPAVKLLWMVGALLGLAMVALGGALWRHRSMELAEENRKQAEIAAKTAQANAEAEAAKARQAEAVAKAEEAKAKIAEAKLPKAAAASVSGDAKVATTSGRHHAAHHGAAKGAKTTVAKGGADEKAKPGAKPSKKGDDVVDKLLASFK